MAKVESDGNGGALVRFGFKEYATITTIVTAVCGIMVSVMIYIVDLMFEAVKAAIKSHNSNPEIHQTILQKDRIFVTEAEFESWKDGHLVKPHGDVAERISALESKCAIIQDRLDRSGR